MLCTLLLIGAIACTVGALIRNGHDDDAPPLFILALFAFILWLIVCH